jgi:hypothetical protein
MFGVELERFSGKNKLVIEQDFYGVIFLASLEGEHPDQKRRVTVAEAECGARAKIRRSGQSRRELPDAGRLLGRPVIGFVPFRRGGAGGVASALPN